MLVLISILTSMPKFFQYIQSREGQQLKDPVLEMLPAYDCSIFIFCAMYILSLYAIYLSWKNSWLFFRYAFAYVLVTLFRAFCIIVLPLEPPAGLVTLTDPFVTFMYGGMEVTKDLFFSGHTSSMYLIYLVVKNTNAKYLALFVSISVGVMLLIQHIHYTIDVIFAYPATYFCYKISEKYTSLKSE